MKTEHVPFNFGSHRERKALSREWAQLRIDHSRRLFWRRLTVALWLLAIACWVAVLAPIAKADVSKPLVVTKAYCDYADLFPGNVVNLPRVEAACEGV